MQSDDSKGKRTVKRTQGRNPVKGKAAMKNAKIEKEYKLFGKMANSRSKHVRGRVKRIVTLKKTRFVTPKSRPRRK